MLIMPDLRSLLEPIGPAHHLLLASMPDRWPILFLFTPPDQLLPGSW